MEAIMSVAETAVREAGQDFIRDIIRADLASGRHKTIVTRFPPEPNGYLHIGHAKSICLNFGVAEEFGGHCNLRYDDTNPTKEAQEYIDAIERDVRWLGFDWGTHLYHASDYFERLYEWAEYLIRAGKAYVDDQTQEEMRLTRGTLTEAGTESPVSRTRRRGKPRSVPPHARWRISQRRAACCAPRSTWAPATSTCATRCSTASFTPSIRTPERRGASIRATISLTASPTPSRALPTRSARSNSRIIGRSTTGSSTTCRFPSHPHQYEFARLNLTYTVLSKRVLTELVRGGHVSGWDDPRMPTLAGLRRRGVPPAAIRDFVKRIGVAKANSIGRCRHAGVFHPRAPEQDGAAADGRACGR